MDHAAAIWMVVQGSKVVVINLRMTGALPAGLTAASTRQARAAETAYLVAVMMATSLRGLYLSTQPAQAVKFYQPAFSSRLQLSKLSIAEP